MPTTKNIQSKIDHQKQIILDFLKESLEKFIIDTMEYLKKQSKKPIDEKTLELIAIECTRNAISEGLTLQQILLQSNQNE